MFDKAAHSIGLLLSFCEAFSTSTLSRAAPMMVFCAEVTLANAVTLERENNVAALMALFMQYSSRFPRRVVCLASNYSLCQLLARIFPPLFKCWMMTDL